MADDHEDVFRIEFRRHAQDLRNQRAASNLVQNLSLTALHSRAETGGQDQDVNWAFHNILLFSLLINLRVNVEYRFAELFGHVTHGARFRNERERD